jgi:hypothetical protein
MIVKKTIFLRIMQVYILSVQNGATGWARTQIFSLVLFMLHFLSVTVRLLLVT